MFESYKQKKLNYMVLDGTNIDNFLTVYSHTYQAAIKGVTPNVLRTFSFYDLENAYFMYDVKSIHIFRKVKDKDKGKSVILKGLNDNFFNAILEVISHNKDKKKINGAEGNAAFIREEMGKAERNRNFPGGGKNMNADKENSNHMALWSSNNHEEFGYEYIKDIIKKGEKELYETDKMYHNSNDEYSSHTSDSVEQ
ncbi:hypothetical protein PCYB_094260 [Plasmodium cynomolgi strain B]|uniref:Uncharacterized protein n=1 Tax=Plasmodium cynomolgi (strain B) TaxID=1120755 RepID=K6VBS6_PLACD|nr:hypothetical protein PCYB_094260 [Plasmodium cynomolgi strain B]GAB66642.1 hypothetical protein PCYB_094260 [Plasmodium cynomolgi strain B]